MNYWTDSNHNYTIRDGNPRNRNLIPSRGKILLSQNVRTGFWDHPAAYSVGIRDSITGGKVTMLWSWALTCRLAPLSEMSGSVPPLIVRLYGVHRDKFVLRYRTLRIFSSFILDSPRTWPDNTLRIFYDFLSCPNTLTLTRQGSFVNLCTTRIYILHSAHSHPFPTQL